MPIYEYRCNDCGKEFEELVRSQDTEVACPECKSAKTSRKLSLFAASGTSSPAGRGGSSCKTSSCSTKSCFT